VAFQGKTDLSTGNDPDNVVTGDLDGDGKPDIVVVNFNQGNASTISVFGNTSSGGTISFATRVDYSTGNGTTGIALADMNGDGKPDIIVASGNSGTFSIFPNTTVAAGAISFGARVDYFALYHAQAVVAADLDQDGKPDLVISDFAGGKIAVFQNTSIGGVLSLGQEADYTVGSNPTFLQVADLDGDGLLDVGVSNYASGTVTLYKNYSSPGTIILGGRQDMNWATSTLSFADLNGDGKIDLAAGTGLTGNVDVMQNTYAGGAYSFGPIVTYNTGNYDTYTAVDDMDGDGRPDIAVVNTTGNTVTILRNGPIVPVVPSITAEGPVIFCQGGSVVLVSTAAAGNQWLRNGVVLSGDTASSLVVDTSGIYIVQTTANGITTLADTAIAVTEIVVQSPVITQKGNTLLSNDSTGNQWSFDGTAIAGATTQTLQPAKTGDYTVTAAVGGCVSQPSAVYAWSVSDSGTTVTSWPNPVTSQVTVTWPSSMPAVLTLAISDLQGRIIKVVGNVQSGVTIDVAGLGTGMYFIKVFSDNPYKVYKTEKISKVQ